MTQNPDALCGLIARAARLTVTESMRYSGDLYNTNIQVKSGQAITPGAIVGIDPGYSNVFTWTPGENETINMYAQIQGHVITFVITSDGLSRVLTFNTGFKSTGTLNTGAVAGKVFTITFISDGTNYNEVARTGAM
ncbi:hypothetical protein [Candidatus Methanoperedens nitratireducens]|uniref:Uncharacterized protein n=1 Tax=Candidatus Methanoperedens nitratireducens TaxID=1392998 RepID=A0A284VS04_9EURY|nr:hypothetical protein [Candidatus Methanoperedens nitroreducens]SNQ62052.1 hypothetical protein MNV_570005 [Candidatus Methanoperedens nitroreducens]